MVSSLQQSESYARALRVLGVPVHDTAIGLVIRRRLPVLGDVGLLSRGVIQDADALRRGRSEGLGLINAENPAAPVLRHAGFRQVMTPLHIAELDLQADHAALMHGKWRNRLCRAETAGITIRHVPWDGSDHWLLMEEARQRKARRYRALPHALIRAIASETPGTALMVEAWQGGTALAAMLFLRHGRGATYQLGWTSEPGRRENAHALILARAAAHLRQLGHEMLDLGPVETQINPGLARFKLGSGAVARALGGTWLAIPGL